MKILYVTGTIEDNLSDLLLHGLVSLEKSIDVVNLKPFLYTNYQKDLSQKIYGKGFTYSKLISIKKVNYVQKDSAINYRLKNKYYDLIIFPEVHKLSKYIIRAIYYKNKIAIIDAEDEKYQKISRQWLAYNILYSLKNLQLSPVFIFFIFNYIFSKYNKKKWVFFKRELLNGQNAEPISFAIPKEKITLENFSKKRYLAKIIPGIIETYIYEEENDYYCGYRESFFGLTKQKGGWDCLRHYEILANNCIPYFPDLESCPINTMTNFPKELVLKANKLYELGIEGWDENQWNSLRVLLLNYTLENLTTESLANYVLSYFE